MQETDRSQEAKAMRTKVLGAAHVERSLRSADEFTSPIQQVATEFAWGEVWTRPGLDLKTRSLCTMAILAATGREAELKVHTRGALNNGATKEELRELLLHIGLYAGFPATMEAMRVVREVLAEPGP